jgi:hypothetical protein
MRFPLPSKAPCSGCWASSPVGSVASPDVVVQSALTSQLEDCLARVGSFLVQA